MESVCLCPGLASLSPGERGNSTHINQSEFGLLNVLTSYYLANTKAIIETDDSADINQSEFGSLDVDI